jgi:hypothetical protein
MKEGDIDVREYPTWFFDNVLRMDFKNAIRATDVSKQNYTVVPRHWYIDAWFRCKQCSCEFCWTALEQKYWFEDLFFWIDSCPTLCKECRADVREIKRLRQLYDAKITRTKLRSASIEEKQEVIDIINTMEQSMKKPLEDYLKAARELLWKQIKNQTGK